MGAEDAFYLEEVSMDESSDGEMFDYGEVLVDDGIESEIPDPSSLATMHATLKKAVAAAQGQAASGSTALPLDQTSPPAVDSVGAATPPAVVTNNGTVGANTVLVEDFIRNYLVRMSLTESLESFQAEWYEKKAAGQLKAEADYVPDIYNHNQTLEARCIQLREDVAKWRDIATNVKETWDGLRKERDFHRMHHRRIKQEKDKLLQDIARLRNTVAQYEPAMKAQETKYQKAMREKMLVKLERDKLSTKTDALMSTVAHLENALTHAESGSGNGVTLPPAHGSAPPETARSRARRVVDSVPGLSGTSARSNSRPDYSRTTASSAVKHFTAGNPNGRRKPKKVPRSLAPIGKGAQLPARNRPNPSHSPDFHAEAAPVSGYNSSSVKAHEISIAAIAQHPTKPVVCTVSDDTTWRLWSVPNGELIMVGEGHREWLAGVDFHPHGSVMATTSGDNTVKLWDFANTRCIATIHEHAQAVWDCAFHDTGDFLLTAAGDHSVRMLDVHTGSIAQTFRGHAGAVNSVEWRPYTNTFATASGDKSVSLWDARSGLCTHTYIGHGNAVNKLCFFPDGYSVATADSDGVVKVWDVRNDKTEKVSIDVGPYPANAVSVDRSGTQLAIASDDHTVKVFDVSTNQHVRDLQGHDDSVLACLFDNSSGSLFTGSADGGLRIWG